MPWTDGDAVKHNKKATTPRLKHIWASAANAALKMYKDDGTAVRVANVAVKDALARDKRKA